MEDKLRKIISIALVVVLVPSLIIYLNQRRDKSESEKIYESALNIATSGTATPAPMATMEPVEEPEATERATKSGWIPEPIEEEDPILKEMEEIDLAGLKEVNPDVVAWIRIPGTKINYPIVQGEDNEYYLKHTWDNKRNYTGSIYMESQNTKKFTNYNTIVYGHNMANDSMFGQLSSYKRQSYWEEHPYVYIRTESSVLRYDIFASYETELDSPTYGLSFKQKKTRTNFLAYAAEKSEIETGIEPPYTDLILTLSTCSGDDEVRRVVQARLKMMRITYYDD